MFNLKCHHPWSQACPGDHGICLVPTSDWITSSPFLVEADCVAIGQVECSPCGESATIKKGQNSLSSRKRGQEKEQQRLSPRKCKHCTFQNPPTSAMEELEYQAPWSLQIYQSPYHSSLGLGIEGEGKREVDSPRDISH